MRLNAKTVADLRLPEGKSEHVEWDDELPRFGHRLRLSGKRVQTTWIVQYRTDGQTRKLTIGDVRVISEPKAREAARKLLAKVELGVDPQAERAAKRQAAMLTFRAVAASYLDAYQRARRPSSYRVTKLYLAGAYFKPLHPMPMGEISFADVAARIRSIENAHSAVTAGAARRAVSALFSWATAEGLLGRNPVNPVIGTRRPVDPPSRDRVLAGDELVAIWQAAEDDPQASGGWRDYCRIVRLLMLLGARANEVGGMSWSELDMAAGVWMLPSARSKNGRPHTLALPPPALEIIAGARQRPQGDFLVGSPRLGFKQWAPMKAELDRRLGDRAKIWRHHDLRRSMATGMADLGAAPHVIESALNHAGHRGGVSGIYNRSKYTGEVAAALARWSEYLLALVEGRAGANVIPLRGVS